MNRNKNPTNTMKISTQPLIFYTYAILSHFILIMIVRVECDWLVKCGKCKCKWNSGKKTADCKNQTFTKIPIDLSSELQVLDMSFNNIIKIEENAFTISDLQNLHKLFMRNCSMERLHPIGLKGLEILIELDLSSNLLKTLPRDSFISLVKVRSLILNQNLIEILENGLFRNLKYLHKIELKNNRIKRVNTDVFINVPYLSQIFLNDNYLTFLRKETFEKLKRLASLSLDSNPWNCTCELQIFRDFSLKRNLYTPPTSCYYPVNLRGILWNDDNSGAFACKPKIIYPSRGASINTSKENVTLICRVHASPNTIIAWDYNKQIYSSINYQARVHIQLLREETSNSGQITAASSSGKSNGSSSSSSNSGNIEKEIGRDIFISRLTIIGAEKSDEGIYTCLAENPGGKDEVQMSLLVQKHNAQDLLLQNNLIIIICLMVLGLLSASIFLALITCCIFKRFKAFNNHQQQQQLQLQPEQQQEQHQLQQQQQQHNHHQHQQQTEQQQLHNHLHGNQNHHHHHHHNHNNTTVDVGIGGSDCITTTTTTTTSDDLIDKKLCNNHIGDNVTVTIGIGENVKNHKNDLKTQIKLPNGNGHLIGNSINNFTDLNENSRRLFNENSTKDSLQQNQQITKNDIIQSKCSSSTTSTTATLSRKIPSVYSATSDQHQNQNHHHNIIKTTNEHNSRGEYKPDLLPYIPHLYNGYNNDAKVNLYDEKQQQQQQQQHKSSTNKNSIQCHQQYSSVDDKEENDLHIPPLATTSTMNQIYHHQNDKIDKNSALLRYPSTNLTNSSIKNCSSISNNSSKYITDQTSEYLQTGYIEMTSGSGRRNLNLQPPVSMPIPPLNAGQNLHLPNGGTNSKLVQQYYRQLQNGQIPPMQSVISSSLHQLYQQNDGDDDDDDDDDDNNVLKCSDIDKGDAKHQLDNNQYQQRRQSIVTTSPSLNFLTTNYYPRRQLL